MELVINTSVYCPLCGNRNGSSYFYSDNKRDYYRCSYCNLIHVPPFQYLSGEDELAEYNKHQNSHSDPGYRKFFSRLFNPLSSRLNSGSSGLDFGSGPGPTLSVMFEEEGHSMSLFDIFYAPDKEIFARQYDFITASEVVEHLHNPAIELDLLWSILKPEGWLGLMTKLALDKDAFSKWHYKNDLTHVCFFSIETMEYLTKLWNTKYLLFGKDVILFQKPL
ncbi:MAG: class I SAM-dependent methyltransferase [Spirochaetales bacterium]|nr:class I SAM-dependent methyltransferase [Spirochaetales bacterium]